MTISDFNRKRGKLGGAARWKKHKANPLLKVWCGKGGKAAAKVIREKRRREEELEQPLSDRKLAAAFGSG